MSRCVQSTVYLIVHMFKKSTSIFPRSITQRKTPRLCSHGFFISTSRKFTNKPRILRAARAASRQFQFIASTSSRHETSSPEFNDLGRVPGRPLVGSRVSESDSARMGLMWQRSVRCIFMKQRDFAVYSGCINFHLSVRHLIRSRSILITP